MYLEFYMSMKFDCVLVDFQGDVSLQKQGEEIWLPVEKDIPLEQGDRIKTGSDAYVEILIDDGSSLRLEENAEITLEELSADSVTKKIAESAARKQVRAELMNEQGERLSRRLLIDLKQSAVIEYR